MPQDNKLSLLNEELDEASAKFIQSTIESWKESMMAKLQEEFELAKAAKVEELEQQNVAYREELKNEYSEKLMEAISDLRASIEADVTASVLKNNPDLAVLEQIKELVAPMLNENYVNSAYYSTIEKLNEENEALRHQEQLREGAEALAELLSPYSEKTQKLVLSLIKEGTAEEVTEQFYTIIESLEEVFSEEDDKKEDDSDEGDEGKKPDEEDDDSEDVKDGKKKSKESDEEDDDSDEENDEDGLDESYIKDGVISEDVKKNTKNNSLMSVMRKMALSK